MGWALVREIKVAISDHWQERYQDIFAGIEAKILMEMKEQDRSHTAPTSAELSL